MKLDLNSPAAIAALKVVQEKHSTKDYKELEHILEAEYRCRVVYEDAYG